jgi:hypothetical protein
MSDLEDEQHAVAAFHAWQNLIAAATGNFTALGETFLQEYPSGKVSSRRNGRLDRESRFS